MKDNAATQSEMIETLRRSLTEKSSNLDSKIEQIHRQLERKLDAQTATQDSVLSELSLSLVEQIDQIKSEVTTADEKFTSKYVAHSKKIELNHTLLADRYSSLDQKLTSRSDELSNQVNSQMKHSQEFGEHFERQLVQKAVEADRRWSTELTDLGLELTQMMSNQGKQQEAVAKQNADTVLALAAKLASSTSNIENQMSQSSAVTRDAIVTLQDQLSACHNHFTNVCFNLDKTEAANLQGLQQKITANFVTVNQAMSALDLSVKGKLSTMQSRMTETDSAVLAKMDAANCAIQNHYQHFTDIHSKL
eukprot:COSAG05_NODE_234_length_13214_cov_161.696454_1_plen_305_part_10